MGLLNGAVYVTVLSRLWSRSVAYGTCRRPGGSVRAWYEVLSAGPVIGFACADSPALRTHGAAAATAVGLRRARRRRTECRKSGPRRPKRVSPWPRAPKGTRARRGQRCCETSSAVASRRLALQRLARHGGRLASSARSAATVLNVAAFSSYLPLASTPHSVVFTPM